MTEVPIEVFPILSDEPKSKNDYYFFIIIPIMISLALLVWIGTHNAFWTSLFAVVLTYGVLMLIPALRGDYSSFIRPQPPMIPKDIEIPEEFEGRPNLFLAYLVRNAHEDNELKRIIDERGVGGNPEDMYDRWNIL
jgi:hypothetical protein